MVGAGSPMSSADMRVALVSTVAPEASMASEPQIIRASVSHLVEPATRLDPLKSEAPFWSGLPRSSSAGAAEHP
jgi:hypothetical protein